MSVNRDKTKPIIGKVILVRQKKKNGTKQKKSLTKSLLFKSQDSSFGEESSP